MGTFSTACSGPALCLVAQGNKSVQIGPDTCEYGPERLMVYSVNLPVAFRVTRASVVEPFLTFRLDLDPQRVAALSLELFPHGVTHVPDQRGVHLAPSNAAVVDAPTRLLEVMGDEREAAFTGPLIVDELLTRLLLSPIGAQVAQLGQAESRVERVARHRVDSRALRRTAGGRVPRRIRAHGGVHLPRALQGRHVGEPAAIPEECASSGRRGG